MSVGESVLTQNNMVSPRTGHKAKKGSRYSCTLSLTSG